MSRNTILTLAAVDARFPKHSPRTPQTPTIYAVATVAIRRSITSSGIRTGTSTCTCARFTRTSTSVRSATPP